MTLADDIASDLASVAITETVTLTDSSANTSDASVTALRSPLNKRELAAGGPAGVSPGDIGFSIQANTTSIVPARGDYITDASSNAYTIVSVDTRTLQTVYRCLCRSRV